MNTPHTNSKSIICYSPRPLATYIKIGNKIAYGPATSKFLTSPEAWNLAYLSHDFDTHLQHPDPNFTVIVKRSVRFRLDGSGGDLVSQEINEQFGSLLNLPAPRFVYLLRKHPAFNKFPMYVAYGDAWLNIIEKRSRICRSDALGPAAEEIEPTNLRMAQEILNRIACR
jgi:hypothetical protein